MPTGDRSEPIPRQGPARARGLVGKSRLFHLRSDSLLPNHRGPGGEAAMVAVLKPKDFIMNANPTSAASVAPAPGASAVRAPDRVRERTATLETFDVYRVSLSACRIGAPIAASLTANLRDQFLRASSSVVLNVAEGFGSRSRGVKRRHYEIARGSGTECIAILDLALALGGRSWSRRGEGAVRPRDDDAGETGKSVPLLSPNRTARATSRPSTAPTWPSRLHLFHLSP